jgi:aspartyl/asparaginyl beta-hydroxylase (cupin superfamily)
VSFSSHEQGKTILFDDSFIHEVWHRGDTTRAVLLMDIWHPDLLPQEVMDLTNHLGMKLERD